MVENPETTGQQIAALPEWLRLQGRTHPEMDPAEAEWCSMLHAAALEIERLRSAILGAQAAFCQEHPDAAMAILVQTGVQTV